MLKKLMSTKRTQLEQLRKQEIILCFYARQNEYHMQKWVLIIDFVLRTKRIQTKYIRISILLLLAYIEKTTENKSERHM